MDTALPSPRRIVIAGPNGVGKTTFAREYTRRSARHSGIASVGGVGSLFAM